jgi:sugar phosphate isomerase/epimerase
VTSPQVHVPFDLVREHVALIRDERLNLEIFLSARNLDNLGPGDIEGFLDSLGYSPTITVHAPFMDLSPGGVDEKVRQVTRERFLRVFDAAEVMRPKAVVFHSGYEKWKYDLKPEIWMEGSLRFWPEFIERAAAMGTRIAIENIFEDSPGNLRGLMERLASEHMGICFDTGHFNLFSPLPLSHWMESIGEYIVELHLHDNDGSRDAHLPMGEGDFPFRELFDTLKGRDIICTIEAHSPADVRKSLERFRELAQRV